MENKLIAERYVKVEGIYIKANDAFIQRYTNWSTIQELLDELDIKPIYPTYVDGNYSRTISNGFIKNANFLSFEYRPDGKLWVNRTDGIDKGLYKHFKGKYYNVISTVIDATNSNTGNMNYNVLYMSLKDNKLYTRDLDEFISLRDKEKYPDDKYTQEYRFHHIKDIIE